MDQQEHVSTSAAEPEGLWVSVSDIARMKGVEKSSISRRVARLEAGGFNEVRIAGGKKLINLAAFDKAVGETTDEVREANGNQRGAGPAPRRGSGLASEQARKTSYQAEMARLDLAEREGKLLPTENVANAAARAGETMVRILDRLPGRTDDIVAAVRTEGAPGVRAILKAIVHDARARLAVELKRLGEQPEAPELSAWPKSAERLATLDTETKNLFDLISERAP